MSYKVADLPLEKGKVLLASYLDVDSNTRKSIFAAVEVTDCFDYWDWNGKFTLFIGISQNAHRTNNTEAPRWLQTQNIVQPVATADSVVLTSFDFCETTTANIGEKLLITFARKLQKHSIEDLLGSDSIESITYTDRYMVRPIHYTLLLSTVNAILRHGKRTKSVPVTIITKSEISDNLYNNWSIISLGNAWPTQDFRNKTLCQLESIVNTSDSLLALKCQFLRDNPEHFRRLSIRFTNGKVLHIGFDQGQDFAMLTSTPDYVLRRDGDKPEEVAKQLLRYLIPTSADYLGRLKASANSLQIALWWE